MAANYQTNVPENNLRLPDALTIQHGQAPLLARFILEADKAARAAGIYLRVRHDFDRLAELNDEQVALGNWYPLIEMLDPRRSDVSPENAYWISGENDAGEIVSTNAGRIYDWSDTNLAEQAVAMMYGRDDGQPVIITTDVLKTITGVVQSMGATWVRPDFRSRGLSHVLPRVGRAYGLSRWPVEWIIAFVTMAHYKNGYAFGYGARNFSSSVIYPEHHLPELVLAYTTRDEAYEDLDSYLTELSDFSPSKFAARPAETFVAQEVMKISPDDVRHGSSSRS
jgi:hypothetical protein